MEQFNKRARDMAYTASLTGNQQLTIANQGIQTNITLISSSPGQQQSQSSSFSTGNWKTAPQLYKTATGFVLKIEGDRGLYFIMIQASSISTISAPNLDNATKVDLETIPDPVANPNNMGFQPMQPMQPMRMGNMSMDINSMSMQMGNMSMNMGKSSTSTRRFCSQCGEPAKPSDRFCSSCGHQLD